VSGDRSPPSRLSVPHFATEGKGFGKVSSPATGSEPPAATDAPAAPAVTPPVAPPAQPPAEPPAQGDSGRGSRELIASINALPEKLANVLLERTPVATNTGTPQNVVPAQGDANSPGTAGVPANASPTPGQGGNSGDSPSAAAGAPTSKSGNKFTDWWFGG
jgi:hypothetical protein